MVYNEIIGERTLNKLNRLEVFLRDFLMKKCSENHTSAWVFSKLAKPKSVFARALIEKFVKQAHQYITT